VRESATDDQTQRFLAFGPRDGTVFIVEVAKVELPTVRRLENKRLRVVVHLSIIASTSQGLYKELGKLILGGWAEKAVKQTHLYCSIIE
jgi:hypothetical protein